MKALRLLVLPTLAIFFFSFVGVFACGTGGSGNSTDTDQVETDVPESEGVDDDLATDPDPVDVQELEDGAERVEDLEDGRIGRLSGGQQQRVFIARAIVNQPHILFLDEPTTGVDAETQEHFYELLDKLNEKEKITIVLITHETGIINKHVKQVACLNQSLVYHGTHADFCRSQEFKKMLAGGNHVVSHRH